MYEKQSLFAEKMWKPYISLVFGMISKLFGKKALFFICFRHFLHSGRIRPQRRLKER